MAIERELQKNPAENGVTNMAAWVTAANTIEIMPYKPPSLGPKDVRVGIKAMGICGSDVHILKTTTLASYVMEAALVIGHEAAGVIEEVGSEVKGLKPGDRVSLEPGISCWSCQRCKSGHYNLCIHDKSCGLPGVNGFLANHITHPANLCYKLPENVSLEEGAMCEPLSVAVHSCRRGGVGAETNVLILGAGPIGLLTLLAAKAFGAPRVVITDINEHHLTLAKKLGADECILVSTDEQDVEDEVIKLQEAMEGEINVTVDCVGITKTMCTAIKATEPGGKVCLVGLGADELTVPLLTASIREVDILGVFRYRNTWALCLDLIKKGKVNLKPLITHRFGFSQREVEEAFHTAATSKNAIKVMFKV